MNILVDSFREFLTELEWIKAESEYTQKTSFYRGQANDNWEIAPGIFRKNKDAGGSLEQSEDDLLDDFGSYFHEEFRDKTAFEKLLTAQHYGLPTRLLDVTLNPLIALYFACSNKEQKSENGKVICYAVSKGIILDSNSDKLSIFSNIAFLKFTDKKGIRRLAVGANYKKYNEWNDEFVELLSQTSSNLKEYTSYLRLMHLLKCEVGHFDNKIYNKQLKSYYFVKPIYSNERIRAQSGGFVISGLLKRYLRLGKNPNHIAHQLIIEAKAKAKILKELDALNINEMTLFPDMEHGAAYLAAKYRRES